MDEKWVCVILSQILNFCKHKNARLRSIQDFINILILEFFPNVDNSCINITMNVKIKMPQGLVWINGFKSFSDIDDRSIQPMPIFPCCIFLHRKINTTPINVINVHGVLCKVMMHHHLSMQKHTQSIFVPIQHKQIATLKWMHSTTSPDITRQKVNENNLFHWCLPQWKLEIMLCSYCCIKCSEFDIIQS